MICTRILHGCQICKRSSKKKLFHQRFQDAPPTLFLYDVTSTYLEGMCNELANWGLQSRQEKREKTNCHRIADWSGWTARGCQGL